MIKLNIFRPAPYNPCETCYHSVKHDLLDTFYFTCVLKHSCLQALSGTCFDKIDKSLIEDYE